MQIKCPKNNKQIEHGVSEKTQGSATCPKYEHIVHPFLPLYDENSTILILGSLPSVKSREQMFFYGHPQNRFWKVMAAITGEKIPETIEEKKELLHKHHIALWDTIYSCDIVGSSDSSIKNVVLPSTSPANAAFSLERLIDAWQKLIVDACGRGLI